MTELVQPDEIRVSDADRSKVQESLRRAHDIGQLDLGEFDDLWGLIGLAPAP